MVSESDKDEAKGRIKEATGSLTGNKDLEREGKTDQMVADAKDAVEGLKDKATGLLDKARDAVQGDDKN